MKETDSSATMGIMKVTIECSGTISIPLHAVASRELEMDQTALKLSIAPERWSGSLLYNEWKAREEEGRASVDIVLHPETLTSQEWTDILPWIETYYTTSKLLIPETARGYDVLAAVEFFGILFQPDQCHFANFDVYKRMQQWSKYLCHRATLAAWVEQQLDGSVFQKFAFGTGTGSSMELGTRALAHLGDTTIAPGINSMSMAETAYKLFNSSEMSPSGEVTDDSVSPEETTAMEMREDFAAYLQSSVGGTVIFAIKPVTIYKEMPPSTSLESSIGASTPPRLQVVNRAVLFVDISEGTRLKEGQEMQLLMVKQARSKSDLSAPVDELVEEELAAGRLEELVQEVDHRNKLNAKRNLKVTFKTSPTSVIEEPQNPFVYERLSGQIEEKSMQKATQSTASEQSSVSLNVPDDELGAPIQSSSAKRKKKKPVFELPDRLLEDPKMLPQQVVKSPADLKGIVPLPPISLIRATTHDQPSVTSALTGPFYVDDDGNIRDAFERSSDQNKDGDDDTRAQARRHEWIQGALLNEGIDQRVQELLSAGEESSDSTVDAGLDPWEWFTGLGVCEFSRSMLESMEEYASGIGGAGANKDGAPLVAVPLAGSEKAPEAQSPNNDQSLKGPTAPAIVESQVSEDNCINEKSLTMPAAVSQDIQPVRRSPSRVKDRMMAVLQEIRAHEAQSRDSSHGIEQHPQNFGGDGTREDGAKSQLSDQTSSESPRGVVHYVADPLTNIHKPDRTENSSRKSMEAADEEKKVKFTDQMSMEASRGVAQRVTGCFRTDISSRKSMEAAGEETAKRSGELTAVATLSDVSPKRKIWGLKGLFRRR